MDSSKVSVIVPVYKVEEYLSKCIESIINQTYTNLEIILVDDGSPDNCGNICDMYATSDARVKVIHKENGGLSDARNAGLDSCSGEYIIFVDSDDYIELDMVETLYEAIEDNDVVICNYYDVDQSGNKTYKSYSKEVFMMEEDKKYNYFYDEYHIPAVVAWNKLYKASLFADGLRFPVGKINEDEVLMPSIFSKAKKILFRLDKCLYNYVSREGSIIHTFNMKRFQMIDILMDRDQLFEKDSFYYFQNKYYTFNKLILLLDEARENNIEESVLKDYYVNLDIVGKELLENKYCSSKQKIKIRMVLLSKNSIHYFAKKMN